MLKDYSIECAQPYGNEDGEHMPFAVALRRFLNEVQARGQTASLVALVDDKTFPDASFDFGSYAGWLSANGFAPDLVARESQIVDACTRVLESISYDALEPALAKALQSEQKYISQLFVASWNLLRLGYIKLDFFRADLQAKRLVNILPASFKPGEIESLQIIRATPYKDAAIRIEYSFIPERSGTVDSVMIS